MAAQQQYVPVSMVEPSGRQMLAVQTSWPTSSRQMAAIVPSWQSIPTQHATIQQPLSDLTDWGRPLLVDSSALIQVGIVLMQEMKEMYMAACAYANYMLSYGI